MILPIVAHELQKIDPPITETFIEVFCGKGNYTREARADGGRGYDFDERYNKNHDFLSVTGALNIAYHAKKVKEDGLGVVAPCCSSWPTFLCAGTHMRNTELGIFGDEEQPFVYQGNLTAVHVSWLSQLLHFRGVRIMVEQPQDSLQPQHPSMEMACEITKPDKHHTWLGSFGNEIPKPTYLWTTMNYDAAHKNLVPSQLLQFSLSQRKRFMFWCARESYDLIWFGFR